MTQSVPVATTEKFQSAEQMWFWFLYSRSMRCNIMARQRSNPTRRPCEVLDVETMITKLYLAGKLTDAQLNVLKEFGDKRRAPHQHIWKENYACTQWNTAMNILDQAAKERGWIE